MMESGRAARGAAGYGGLAWLPVAGLALLAAFWLFAPRRHTPERFLRWSLARHGALRSLRAACRWSLAFDGQAPTFTSVRTLDYARPNRYRVAAEDGRGVTLTSVSDGLRATEYSSRPGSDPQEYPAPPTLGGAATLFLRNPLQCGSPLHLFLAGPAAYDALVDSGRGEVAFGPDEEVAGVACRVVRFPARGRYGGMEAAIGAGDGWLRRVRYASESVVAGARVASPDAPLPKTAETVELYTEWRPNATPAEDAFDTAPPVAPPPPAPEPEPSPTKPSPIRARPLPPKYEQGDSPLPVGQPAPDFALRDMNGKTIRLSDARGKVALVLFFSTRRSSSTEALRRVERLRSELESQGLALFAVSREGRGMVRRYLRRRELGDLPAYLDPQGAAHARYKAEKTPLAVVIDREGRLARYRSLMPDVAALRADLRAAGLDATRNEGAGE